MNTTNLQPLSHLGQWASWHVQQGLAVFQLAEKSKAPRRGSHGYMDATKDLKKIRELWTNYPNGNIAAATGSASGFVAIDVDGNTGWQTLADLQSRLGALPPTSCTITPGKIEEGKHGGEGAHLFYRLPEGISLDSRNGIALKVDLKAEKGYIVLPASIHPDGTGIYQTGSYQNGTEIAELPKQWIEFLVNVTTRNSVPATAVVIERPITQSPVNSGSVVLDDHLSKRIVDYLNQCAPAVQGQNGHSTLLTVANALVHGFCLEPDTATNIAWQHFNPRCLPCWTNAEWNDFHRKFTEARDIRALERSRPFAAT